MQSSGQNGKAVGALPSAWAPDLLLPPKGAGIVAPLLHLRRHDIPPPQPVALLSPDQPTSQHHRVVGAEAADTLEAPLNVLLPPSPGAPREALEGIAREYAAAYSTVKEQLEVRLRHEARRADFFEGSAARLEVELADCRATLDHAHG